ncbi:MAG: glycosyltransferase family 4 protein [Bdellovibrionota bacterium]
MPPKLYGGTERVVYNLCRGLGKLGIEVTLFASGDSAVSGAPGAPSADVPDINVELIPVVKEALRLSKNAIQDHVAYSYKMLAEVASRAGSFDIIHNNHDYWMLPLTEMTRVPVLTTMHGRLDLPDIEAPLMSFPKACFVSISDSQRLPLPALNWFSTIYHGLEVSDFAFHPKPGSYLAFLGRIVADKRPEWAVEIAKLSGVPLKIAAKIEGSCGRDYYDTYVGPHVDGKFIEYVGEISEKEKSEFLGNAMALVFPIDWPEPFGLVMIESLACGTPVLARPCGSVPELLVDGVTGFSDLDIHGLAARVGDVARIDRRRCRLWVEQYFSLQRMTEDYVSVYRHLIDQFIETYSS